MARECHKGNERMVTMCLLLALKKEIISGYNYGSNFMNYGYDYYSGQAGGKRVVL